HVLQPVVGAASGERPELCRHRPRDRLPAVDDVVDRLAGDAGSLAHRDLVETKTLKLGAQMFARLERAAVFAAVRNSCGHRCLLARPTAPQSRAAERMFTT